MVTVPVATLKIPKSGFFGIHSKSDVRTFGVRVQWGKVRLRTFEITSSGNRQRNLNPKNAGRWKNVFLKEGRERFDSATEIELVPLKLQETVCPSKASGVRLELGDIHIELQTNFDVQTLL